MSTDVVDFIYVAFLFKNTSIPLIDNVQDIVHKNNGQK